MTVVTALSVACAVGCTRKRTGPSPSPSQSPSSARRVAKAEAAPRAAPRAAVTGVWKPAPGAPAWPASLRAQVAAALAKVPPAYRPRTRHFTPRSPKSTAAPEPARAGHGGHGDPRAPAGARPHYTNRLLLEASPYLRQHAHNPVDWRPWGPEAFAEARKLGRPIFLSVGYATCHWCHVMEHESFEDVAIATLLNSRYVPVKVDREERPDVDAIYMAAVHAMHGNGGWPMSVWIAPGDASQGLRGVPFFAGTYFPPRDGARGRRKGFATLLTELADRFKNDPEHIARYGAQVAARMKASLAASQSGPRVGPAVTDRLVAAVARRFDPVHGGSRGRPKFPSNVPVRALLRHHLRTGDAHSKHMAVFTLKQMGRGGIYDHVGGGFARYSTDARWLVPHFEKMLYDQALILRALVEAWVVAPDAELERLIRETVAYLLREMRRPDGAFYSATDADSEGEEGRFFLWTPAQIDAVVGPVEGRLLREVYGVRPGGNFEGRTILSLRRSLADEALARKVDAQALRARLRASLDKLELARRKRVPPLLDDKVITAWNGLLIGALASAGFHLREPLWVAAATRAADVIDRKLRTPDGRLLRIARAGQARVSGLLTDYAYFIAALLDVFEATGEPRWLARALALQRQQDRWFLDRKAGAYFATPSDAPALLAREKPDYDGARPSPNSVAAMNLVRISALTGERTWADRARETLGAFAGRLHRAPRAMTEAFVAVEALSWPMREVVLVRPKGADAEPMLRVLRRTWQPHRALIQVEAGAGVAALQQSSPLVRAKVPRQGKVTAYVCVAGACKLPTTDPNVLRRQLLEVRDPD